MTAAEIEEYHTDFRSVLGGLTRLREAVGLNGFGVQIPMNPA